MDRAHRRVGAAAIAAFLALLLIGAAHGPAQADSATPATTQPAAPTVEPSQPEPFDPDRGFHHDGDRDHDGFGPGPAQPSAPGTGGNTT